MKRIFAFFLSILLILGICPMSALADTGGSGNVDGGGGSMGQGTSQNSWNPGMDGVRVTVIYSETQKPASASIDLTSKTPAIKIHFGKVSKIQYRDEALSLRQQAVCLLQSCDYNAEDHQHGSSKASIEAIKKYFCDEIIVRYIAELTGISYDDLIRESINCFWSQSPTSSTMELCTP